MYNYQVVYCSAIYSKHKNLNTAMQDLKHLVRKYGINDVDLVYIGDDIKTIRVIITKED